MIPSNEQVITNALKNRTIINIDYSDSHGRVVTLKLDNGDEISFTSEKFSKDGFLWEELAVFINGDKF